MKINFTHHQNPNFFAKLSRGAGLFLFTVLNLNLLAQQSFSFTPCGATGSVGPNQTMANNTYSSTNLSGSVSVSGGIQSWTVPVTGAYRIEARGAKGYGTNAGRGAIIAGDFSLTAGTVLKILPGNQGAPPISPGTNQYGGGGGSFVTYTNNTALVIAGGGGGSWAQSFTGLSDGTVAANGNPGAGANCNIGTGGSSGNGGGNSSSADGGGGLNGNGGGTAGGLAFVNGATGGALYGHGGFGGGGGASSWDNRRGGGGGGYSGGGGSHGGTTYFPEGGGGGSINNGANPTNTSGANNANGMVVITELCNISLTASGANSLAPVICSGSSVTLTTNGVSNYNWSTGNTTSSVIVVSPSVTTTYSLSATSISACTAYAYITVTVSSGPPVLTVASTTNNVCLGMSVTFTASGALTYTWSGGINNMTAFSPSVTTTYTVTGQNGCGTGTAVSAVTVAPLSVNVVSSASAVCAGTSATLTASAAANSYTWLPLTSTGSSTLAVSPQFNTLYTVIASNGTCIGTGTVSISTIQIPTVTASSSSSLICEGESATLTATGGNNYTWTPGNQTGSTVVVTPTAPTLYSVVADNSFSCFAGSSQIIIVNPAPVLTLNASSYYVCSQSSVALSASGANIYYWSNAVTTASQVVTVMQNTSYTVLGTNTLTGCASTATIDISVYNPVLTVSGNTLICTGATASLLASGANTYSWSNGVPFANNNVSPLVNTTYTLSANATSLSLTCPISQTVTVVVNPNPTVTATANKTVMCKDENLVITANGANTYSWSNSSATTSTISITPNLVTSLFIYVTGTSVTTGCSATGSIVIQVNGCIGLSENKEVNDLVVFPNPSSGDLHFRFEGSENLDLVIYNELGQVVKHIELNGSTQHKASVSGLAAGVYFVSGKINSQIIQQKVIITR